jgi:hypothetical protein
MKLIIKLYSINSLRVLRFINQSDLNLFILFRHFIYIRQLQFKVTVGTLYSDL